MLGARGQCIARPTVGFRNSSQRSPNCVLVATHSQLSGLAGGDQARTCATATFRSQRGGFTHSATATLCTNNSKFPNATLRLALPRTTLHEELTARWYQITLTALLEVRTAAAAVRRVLPDLAASSARRSRVATRRRALRPVRTTTSPGSSPVEDGSRR